MADMTPDFVEVELSRRMGERRGSELKKKRVYLTEVDGVITLDLYSGWELEGEELKFKLLQLPIKVCSFVQLQKLWVSHNSLTELPGQIDQLVNLKEIYLHHNSFTSIPVRLFRLVNLEIVWLSSNQITQVSSEISSLVKLRHLHLEHNQITEYQESLNQLPSLAVLYLNHNLLSFLSYDIHKLSATLKRLYLQHNKLQMLPDTICLLESLEILYLESNEINTVPQGFEAFCQKISAANKAVIQVANNPYIVPRSKVKLSVGGTPPNIQGLQLSISTRRHSDYSGPMGRERSATEGSNNMRSSRYSVPTGGIVVQPPTRETEDEELQRKKSATLNR